MKLLKFCSIPLLLLFLNGCTHELPPSKTKELKDKKASLDLKELSHKPSEILSFEDPSFSTWLNCDTNSTFELSNEHFQHGQNSLLWSCSENGFIQLNQQTPGLTNPEKVKELRVWIYSEQPGGHLEIQAGDPEQFDRQDGTYQSVDYQLNFQGWRSLWVKFNLDGQLIANGQKTSLSSDSQIPINSIRLKAINKKSNNLYFDNLEVSEKPIPHGRLGNLQMPEIKNDPTNRHNFPWIALDHELDQQELQDFNFKEADLQQIMQRLKLILAKGIGKRGKAKKGFEHFEKMVNIDAQGRTRGPAIYSHIVERYYKQNGAPGIHTNTINGALAWSAAQYLATGDETWKQRYISYLDFRHDKGYAYGSAAMNLVFEAKNAANYLDSLIKMRPHLDDQRLRREADGIRWMCGYKYLYSKDKAPVDADKILGDMLTLMVATYLQPQSTLQEKKRKLYDFSKFKEIIDLTTAPGISNDKRAHIVKPDYSIWHHGMEMTYSYGYAAAHRYMIYYYVLHGTPAALDPKTAKGIIAYYADLFTSEGQGSYMASRGLGPGSINSYAQMLSYAVVANIDLAKSVLKGFLQANTLSINKLPKTLQSDLKEKLSNNTTITPYTVAQGTHSRPYAALLTHHNENSTAVIRGINQGVASSEIFLKDVNAANLYGQQQNNGFLQLYSPEGPQKSGLDLNGGGWDWSLYPGATTAKLNHQQRKENLSHGKIKFESETLSGGLSHFNKSGLFYQELTASKQHLLKNLSGHKSWFFFDDTIICLGSNLSLSGVDAPLVTTLFQYHHDKTNTSLPFYTANGHQEHSGPIKESVLANNNEALISPAANAFSVFSQDPIKIKRALQKSYDHKNRQNETSGYVSSAWIDHGHNPQNASYEYLIKTQAEKTNLTSLNKDLIYTVLQKDDAAHIVKHIPSSSTAYTILKDGISLPSGPLLNSEKPLLIMISEDKETMKVTVCDPRLKISAADITDRSTIHKILLKGQWQNATCSKDPDALLSLQVKDSATELTIRCIDGKSYDMILNK